MLLKTKQNKEKPPPGSQSLSNPFVGLAAISPKGKGALEGTAKPSLVLGSAHLLHPWCSQQLSIPPRCPNWVCRSSSSHWALPGDPLRKPLPRQVGLGQPPRVAGPSSLPALASTLHASALTPSHPPTLIQTLPGSWGKRSHGSSSTRGVAGISVELLGKPVFQRGARDLWSLVTREVAPASTTPRESPIPVGP